jgi:hypothetical protein
VACEIGCTCKRRRLSRPLGRHRTRETVGACMGPWIHRSCRVESGVHELWHAGSIRIALSLMRLIRATNQRSGRYHQGANSCSTIDARIHRKQRTSAEDAPSARIDGTGAARCHRCGVLPRSAQKVYRWKTISVWVCKVNPKRRLRALVRFALTNHHGPFHGPPRCQKLT